MLSSEEIIFIVSGAVATWVKEFIPNITASSTISEIKMLISVNRNTMMILAVISFLREIGYMKSTVIVLFLYSSIMSLLNKTDAKMINVALTKI
ncbi:hypothetical protein D3C81_2074850 [compost metagenome]